MDILLPEYELNHIAPRRGHPSCYLYQQGVALIPIRHDPLADEGDF